MGEHHEAAPAPADYSTRAQDALFLAGALAITALQLALIGAVLRDPFAFFSIFF
jgi:hypothetical protein